MVDYPEMISGFFNLRFKRHKFAILDDERHRHVNSIPVFVKGECAENRVKIFDVRHRLLDGRGIGYACIGYRFG